MKKFLSVDAADEVIKYWQDLGYEIVFTFTPDKEDEIKVVRPDYSKKSLCGQLLDPELVGVWV